MPRTQSTDLHSGASTQDADAPAAAILRRRGIALLTLAPTRRARAPPQSYAQERKSRSKRPVTGRPAPSREDSIGCRFASRDLAISREVSERRTPVCLPPLRAPPPPPPPSPPPPASPPYLPLSPPLLPGPWSGRGAATQTVSRGRRDPHGKMAAAGPGGRAERLHGAPGWAGARRSEAGGLCPPS